MNEGQAHGFTQAQLDARYVQRESHEYRQLIDKVNAWSSSSARVERYLIGGIDEEGKYTIGMGIWFKVAAFIGSFSAVVVAAVIAALVTHQGRLW